MKSSRLLLLLLIVFAIGAFFYFDLQQFLTLDMLKSKQAELLDTWSTHPVRVTAIFGLIYIAVTGLSLPGAVILTLAGGAIFGLLWGTVIVSFASTIGATLAFLAARFLFRDSVMNRFGDRLTTINQGIAKEGAFYLFSLRLVPLFPFFIINLVMGLTTIKTTTFYWVSQLGMLAGTIVYVYAGTQLGKIDSLADIVSPGLLAAFVMLGIFTLLAKTLVNRIKQHKESENE
jgi:uncharacterized membrane protein YdjX (TVP38/TMEM64 family)